VDAELKGLTSPTKLGPEFLTFVLWAVSPDGRAINLGGVSFGENGRASLKSTTPLQSFSLLLTAEPYAAVRQPSEMLVLENAVRKNTNGKPFVVEDYKLIKRSQYQKLGNPLAIVPDLKSAPVEMYEARNAVDIAASREAERYAPDTFTRAEDSLRAAEKALARKANWKDVASSARLAAQYAEDARALSIDRQEQQRIAAERAAAAARTKAAADASTAATTAAEARRRAEEDARRQAELAAAREAQKRAEAAAVEAEMHAEEEIAASRTRAREATVRAEVDRSRGAAAELRAQLFDQFSRILETRDAPRGLIVTVSDGLFDPGKHDLRMDAREKLARFSGIVLAHPGLEIEVGGHTDSVGSEDSNLKASKQRAETVRNYLLRQGLPEECITAVGYGPELPVSDNNTAAGRQQNRRVELMVSGQMIEVKAGR
jgi:outer membrane protein OmpA-like peptidoglycan-associated protein